MIDQKAAAKQFAAEWEGKGYEKGQSQSFWLALLRDVFGVAKPEQFIEFEDQVHLDNTAFIDGYIPSTKVLIEQKSLGKDLNKAIKQSDGSMLNPFQQAKRYILELPVSRHPRWVVTCNFSEFYVYDMEKPHGDPEKIKLADFEKEYYRLQFLVDPGNTHLQREMEISMAAGDIVGKLYDAFLNQYKDRDNPETLKSLNKLCVRLVFCLYAEDAGVFGKKSLFHDYLSQYDAKGARKALRELFKILDQKPEDRDPYLADDDAQLAAFPYVNGGLFSDEEIEIPPLTDEILNLILKNASDDFDWSEISPTIFGAVFESTLNPETRRSGGMHYTSIENIHKVIDPLFLDDLKAEFEEITKISVWKTQETGLRKFQDKLASLEFLDPAAGSGNFLTEGYLCIRRLENQVIQLLQRDQVVFGDTKNPIKVSISQFHGIEINDFAVTVAKTALWIAESQMMKETEEIVLMDLEFLPLKTVANIVERNALRIDWNDVVSKERLNYIMGNPPFSAAAMTKEQKADRSFVFSGNGGELDYVTCWYKKAADYIAGTTITCAFVSTNSICQGQQVAPLWKPLFDQGIEIDFAYQTFRWDSEAKIKAHVHCVIIGFSNKRDGKIKRLYSGDRSEYVDYINAYLMDGPDVILESRSKPICDVPAMRSGGKPVEGGHLIFTEQEKTEFLHDEPKAEKYMRPFMGSDDFINGHGRWCLWLLNADPAELRSMPRVLERIEKVKQFRQASVKAATRELAKQPARFAEIKQPNGDYLLIPATSSENRRYVPIGYLNKDVVASNAASFVPDATLYHFGILISNIHMAWMRAVCGRLKSDYRYSINIVYNNFPWPEPTYAQKVKVEQTAQAILDARALYMKATLADLYDELTMPPELRKAHQDNDKAVMDAYGIKKGNEAYTSEAACVAWLMRLYQKKVGDQA